MGSTFTSDDIKTYHVGQVVEALKRHPNYEDKYPIKGETKTQFTLRCIAHLVSPPMEENESNEVECVDLASAILAMNDEIEEKWKSGTKK